MTMPRLKIVDPARATGPSKEMLDGIQRKMGKVPNIFRSMANSPAALGFYLGGSEALSKASLSPAIREQVALAVAQAGSCDYCLAAHTAIGRGAGLSDDQMLAARRGTGSDPRAAAAVVFARKLVHARGDLSDADVAAARKGGLDDGELAEVLAVVSLNLYTTYFNHMNGTEVDFPPAPKLT
jgi:uncharacterized peroxidase-related enzyme